MKKHLLYAVLLFPLVLLGGCSGGGSESGAASSGVAAEFVGDYFIACNPLYRDTYQVSITANKMIRTINVFEDDNCTQPTTETISTLSLVYPGGTTTTVFGEAVNIDVQLLSSQLNGQVDNTVDTSRVFYTIMLLDGIKLFLGNNNGDTPENRSTTLDIDPYIRQ